MFRYLFILIAAMSFVANALAQDILITNNGDEIEVKVVEVNFNTIKYNKYSNLQGPIYTMYTTEIFMIKYENGDKDIYKEGINQTTQSTNIQDHSGSNGIHGPYSHTPTPISNDEKKMAAYAELGGACLVTSANFEMMFVQSSKFNFGARSGLGIGVVAGDLSLALPVHATFLVGNGNHFYEGGIGFTVLAGANLQLHTNHGYRYQPKGKSFFIRGNLNFLYDTGWGSLIFMPGGSYGRRF